MLVEGDDNRVGGGGGWKEEFRTPVRKEPPVLFFALVFR